ncbi:multicopper oxidase domain-containing protein [Streptomyces sp. NPDC051704]|uniref:multicopper oxidase domain-containing protein n=1 Tax=Streptomyces sp. NPDC051704 TaxID=3365671 RepID=UPI00379C4ECD
MTLQQGEDTPVVNGKAYPFPAVERRRYRLRILNASNERFWRLHLTFNAVPFMEPSEDFAKAGSTEIWEYVNPNHDAHPMHVHLVNFQVLNRQPIDTAGYQEQYEKWIDGGRKPEDGPVLGNYLTGPPIPPVLDEANANKGTVKSHPETVTRIIIREFTPPTDTIASIPGSGTEFPAEYVHHCHILEHEDDDLMHPRTILQDTP